MHHPDGATLTPGSTEHPCQDHKPKPHLLRLQDAQSGAATAALHRLLDAAQGSALCGRLPAGFQRLWAQLAAAGMPHSSPNDGAS
jgi:hypothetical protein